MEKKSKEDFLLDTMRCTITEDAEDENENYYFKWNDVLTVMQQFSDQENKGLKEENKELKEKIENNESEIKILLTTKIWEFVEDFYGKDWSHIPIHDWIVKNIEEINS